MKSLLKELRHQGISNKTINIIKKIDRISFVPRQYKNQAYLNIPLPIGPEQTISQPYTVAFMIDKLKLKKSLKVLEIGSGSGWNSALIQEITKTKVYTIEFHKSTYGFAKQNLKPYKNVKLIHADGKKGYKQEEPFDRIIITAASNKIPSELIKQLKTNGILLAPIGPQYHQEMTRITKLKNKKLRTENLGSFVFVALK